MVILILTTAQLIFLEIAKVRNRRLVVGNTLNVLSRIHDNCGPPDLEVKCGENEQCGKWKCQMLRDKLTCDVTCDTGCKFHKVYSQNFTLKWPSDFDPLLK